LDFLSESIPALIQLRHIFRRQLEHHHFFIVCDGFLLRLFFL
jgi:hypothetical protein